MQLIKKTPENENPDKFNKAQKGEGLRILTNA